VSTQKSLKPCFDSINVSLEDAGRIVAKSSGVAKKRLKQHQFSQHFAQDISATPLQLADQRRTVNLLKVACFIYRNHKFILCNIYYTAPSACQD